ncbi:astacin-like metallopeptidase 12 protein [Leptotrombidium deliense]|uniref:Astacin-like metallopeptidase 12 protein n=1 Tax=Leptotrombidium deliense TaxID=299467 RepID=A0A443S9L6_9ACAR|nr:astacin-like metallopeptidase 12 protein [Leptotrombidium deliense]
MSNKFRSLSLFCFAESFHFIPDYPIHYVVNPYRFCHVAMQNPNFDGGDMILPDLANRFGRLNDSYLWPKGRIPYVIDWTIVNSQEKIFSAMQYIESETCIRFQERKNEENYAKGWHQFVEQIATRMLVTRISENI